jgi:hypothetical protein
VSPDDRVTLHACVALLRTLRGVSEETVQAVSTYLGICIEQAERS